MAENIKQMEQQAALLEARLVQLRARIDSAKKKDDAIGEEGGSANSIEGAADDDAANEQIGANNLNGDAMNKDELIDSWAQRRGLADPTTNNDNGDESEENNTTLKKRKRASDKQYLCSTKGCSNHARRGGVCIRHGEVMICSYDGCMNKVYTRGKCKKHDKEDGGAPPTQIIGKKNKRAVCSFEGCERWPLKGGACRDHDGAVNELENENNTTLKKKKRASDKQYLCSTEGCSNHARRGGVCIRHGEVMICSYDGCMNKVYTRGKCKKHDKEDGGAPAHCLKFGKRNTRGPMNEQVLPSMDDVDFYTVCTCFANTGAICGMHPSQPLRHGVPVHNATTEDTSSSSDPNNNIISHRSLVVEGNDSTPRKCHGRGASSSRRQYLCSIDGCSNCARRGGFCVRHGEPVICSHDGCANKVYVGGKCKRHGKDGDGDDAPTPISSDSNISSTKKTVARKNNGGEGGEAEEEEGSTNNSTPKRAQRLRLCSTEGCTNHARRGGVCIKHGAVAMICGYDGCENKVYVRGKCKKHGMR